MKLPNLLENSTNIASLFFGSSVIISVFYEYAFFNAFGVSLPQLPSSISDHIKSSIDVYFYLILVFASCLVLLGLVSRKFSSNSLSVEIVEEYKVSTKRRLYSGFFLFFFVWVYLNSIVKNSNDIENILLRSTSLVVIIALVFNLLERNFEEIFGFLNSHIILMFFICISCIYHMAIYDALIIKAGHGLKVSYEGINVNSNQYLVKTFSSHYVFWDKDSNQLIYKPVSDIKSLAMSKI